MQNIFYEVDTLDKRAIESLGISEDVLMENAASALENEVLKTNAKSICIVAGPGNNGADGIALARRLHGKYNVTLVCPFVLKTPMANIQYERALKVGVYINTHIVQADIVCDALFGSGLTKPLDEETCTLIEAMNQIDAIKIACDIPSGIDKNGVLSAVVFSADITVSMGARKQALYIDAAKDYVGDICVGSLGISENIYAVDSSVKLLEYSDMKLPLRENKNTHKGNFGHLSVFAGNKKGAAKLCAKAGFAFGAGLVSIVSTDIDEVDDYLMLAHSMPSSTTAFAIGMGLGDVYDKMFLKDILLDSEMPAVLDADLLQSPVIEKILTRHKNLVLTPHPKEFSLLLNSLGFGNYSVEEVQAKRFELCALFSEKYDVTLVLKGANTLISKGKAIYVCDMGTNDLSKGGSGDVLAGFIGGLLAIGYSTLDAAISGVIAHAHAGKMFSGNNYALTPYDLIENVKKLEINK